MVVESGLNVYSFLTLRSVCKEGLTRLLQSESELKSRDEKGGVTNNDRGVYSSQDFK